MIDILFLSHRYDISSGGEKALVNLIRQSVKRGLKVHVIIGGQGNIIDILNKLKVGYSIIHLPFWIHGKEDMSPFSFKHPDPKSNTLLEICNTIDILKPKTCVTNTIVVPWLAYAAAIKGVRHAWIIHEASPSGVNLRFSREESQIFSTIDALSDNIFYNSNYTSSFYLDMFLYNKGNNIIYPVDYNQENADIDTKNPFTTKGLKIVSVGQIKEQKGQVDLVNAAAELSRRGVDFQIIFVGGVLDEDRYYMYTLEKKIKDNNLQENIVFVGHLDSPSYILKHADIGVNSAINESFGRVTVEYMLSDVMVIAAASAGTLEIIDDTKTGYLYKPGDHNDLANILSSININSVESKTIKSSARKEAYTKYTGDAVYKSFFKYINSKSNNNHRIDLTPLNSVFENYNELLSNKYSLKQEAKKIIKRLLSK